MKTRKKIKVNEFAVGEIVQKILVEYQYESHQIEKVGTTKKYLIKLEVIELKTN